MAKRKQNRTQNGRATPARTNGTPGRRPFDMEIGDRSVSLQYTETKQHQGPLPTPEDLARYEGVVPGAAERIIRMAEIPFELARDQHDHRVKLETKVISHDVRKSWAGLVVGGLIALTAIVGGVFLIYNDKSGEGLAAIITPVAGISGTFVYSHQSRRKERENQRASG